MTSASNGNGDRSSSGNGGHAGRAIYCPGCNEMFFSDSAGCPRCGGGSLSDSSGPLGKTQLQIHADNPDGEIDSEVTDEDGLDHLIGHDLGVYECRSLIGRGGMGHVFLAHHSRLHRDCALKVLSPRLVNLDTDYVRRFQTEGRSAAALSHQNIITAHAIGESNGYHFLEMEYVRGRSLQNLIEQEGRVTPLRATALVTSIAEGLAEAHKLDIIHRDLKPDNVLLTSRGVAKIADFGLAKRIVADGAMPKKLVGTPNFMAPELLQGHPASPPSDVYALGVCYFLLLTGQLPFTGKSFAELTTQVTTKPVPSIRQHFDGITLDMAEALNRMLDKTPHNRPQNGIGAAMLMQAVMGATRDLESLLSEAFPNHDVVTWTRSGERYELDMKLNTGRRQKLFVEPSDHDTDERLLLIYSICCEAEAGYYEPALRLNSELSHGSLGIREIDGKSMFVMVDTYPRATVDPEEIRRSVLEVGFHADEVEKRLTGGDRH